MASADFQYQDFTSREAMITQASDYIADIIRQAVADRGEAVIMVSGGSSPRPVYEHLSRQDLPWDKVTIGLVDERWVDETDPGSNARFIRSTLLSNRAQKARFIGLTELGHTFEKGVAVVNKRIAAGPYPFDLSIMGMGLDGHTASWFPDSEGLNAAMDIDADCFVAAINASGCPVAGQYAKRVTLTLPAIMASRHIMLLIPGKDKSRVFETSEGHSVFDRPVNALRAAGDRLHIFSDRT